MTDLVDEDRLAENAGIASVSARPQAVADERDGAGGVLLLQVEGAADRGAYAKDGKQLVRRA